MSGRRDLARTSAFPGPQVSPALPAARLPEPEAPIGAYHADFYWPAARLVVETDGRAHHERRAAFERDRQRDLALAALGIETLRVTWRMVTRQEPELARTLRARTFASI